MHKSSIQEADPLPGEAEGEEIEISSYARMLIFAYFLFANFFLNFIVGILPASLISIEKEIPGLSYAAEGLLGSLGSCGISIATLIASATYEKFNAQKILALMLLSHAFWCLVFFFSYDLVIMCMCRVAMGFTQSFCVIYGPIWVNAFSPKESSTRWLGYVQSATPLGIIGGYILASLIINFAPTFVSWRMAILVNITGETCLAICFYFAKAKNVNAVLKEGKSQVNQSSYFHHVKVIMRNFYFYRD